MKPALFAGALKRGSGNRGVTCVIVCCLCSGSVLVCGQEVDLFLSG